MIVRSLVQTCVLALVLALALVGATRADPLDPRGRAKVLKDEGARAFEAGDAATALSRFEAAYRTFPSPNLKYNMGFALDRLGRSAAAIEAFELFLASAIDAPASAVERAREEIARIDRSLGHVLVVAQPGANVHLDELLVGQTPLRAALRVPPGAHALEVTLPDHVPYRARLDLARGMIWSSEVALVPRPRRRVTNLAPILMGSLAIALGAVGAGLRIHSQREFDRLNGSCAPDCAVSDWSGLPAQQGAGNSLLGIAGAALLVDIGLWTAYGLHR